MPKGVECRILTVEDVERPGFPKKGWELWDGAFQVRQASGFLSDNVAGRIHVRVGLYVERRSLGWVTGSSGGYMVARSPDRILVPDVAFVLAARLHGIDPERIFRGSPDFVVEVRSPTDRWQDVIEKCGIWIAHGVSLAWAVEPKRRLIEVFRPLRPSTTFRPGQTLTGDPVLPRFRVRVADLFP